MDFISLIPRENSCRNIWVIISLSLSHKRPKLITYLKPLIEVNPMSIQISISYLRPYISHNNVDTLLAHSNTNLNWNYDDGWVKMDWNWLLILGVTGVGTTCSLLHFSPIPVSMLIPFILMSSFTHAFHLLLVRPLLRRPSTFYIGMYSSSYPFPTLSGVGTTYISSCCDKDSAIIFTC
jgi:hypothetical protein